MADWIKGRVGCVPPLKAGGKSHWESSHSFQLCKGNPPAGQVVPAAAQTVTVIHFTFTFKLDLKDIIYFESKLNVTASIIIK